MLDGRQFAIKSVGLEVEWQQSAVVIFYWRSGAGTAARHV